jgi:hypothetical protein
MSNTASISCKVAIYDMGVAKMPDVIPSKLSKAKLSEKRHGNVTPRQKATIGAKLSTSGLKHAMHHWRHGQTKSAVDTGEIADQFAWRS